MSTDSAATAPSKHPAKNADADPALRAAAAARRLRAHSKAASATASSDYYRGFLAGVDEAAGQVLEAIGPMGE